MNLMMVILLSSACVIKPEPADTPIDTSPSEPETEPSEPSEPSSTSDTCVDDDIYEPNDTPTTPQSLGAGVFNELEICGEDWYKVMLQAGDEASIFVDFEHTKGDIDVKAYGPNGGGVLAESQSSTDDELVQFTAAESGAYPVVLSLLGDNDGVLGNDYSLEVELTRNGGGGSSDCPADALEENDSMENAVLLFEGSFGNLNVCDDDSDWYEIDLSASEVLSVAASFTHSDGDIDIRLYAPEDAAAGYSTTSSISVTNNEAIEYEAEQNGMHYLEVDLLSFTSDSGSNDYVLIISVD